MIPQEALKRQLAKKYGINLGQMTEIIMLHDRFIATVISEKSNRDELYFPSVRLPGFGLFHVPEKKMKVLRRVKYDPNHKFK